jgi:hypothetical protein
MAITARLRHSFSRLTAVAVVVQTATVATVHLVAVPLTTPSLLVLAFLVKATQAVKGTQAKQAAAEVAAKAQSVERRQQPTRAGLAVLAQPTTMTVLRRRTQAVAVGLATQQAARAVQAAAVLVRQVRE